MKLPRKTKEFMENGAPQGERNQSLFDAACQLRDAGLSEHATLAQLTPRGVSDGLSERESGQTIKSAFAHGAPRQPLTRGSRRNYEPKPAPDNKIKQVKYDLTSDGTLPEPLPDPTRSFLKAAFMEGEGICMEKAKLNDDGSEYPPSSGTVFSREEWLRKTDQHDGAPNYYAGKLGVFIRVNPMKAGSGKDNDVTAYRHALIEFDNMSKSEQWQLINKSKVPCTAVIDSGNKSLHAWVRLDAKDAQEFDLRAKALYEHFKPYGLDVKNKNPSRFSRLPGKSRGGGMQSLLALKIGANSFMDWMIAHSEDVELSKPISIRDLSTFDPSNDENSVLGNRWLCKGGSCLWIGPSGIGKSSLQMQAAITWGFGKNFFGIYPNKSTKSLIIQAENDFGDLAEQIQGVAHGMNLNLKDEFTLKTIEEKVVLVRDTIHTSDDFARVIRKLVDQHHPDIVWVDPLLTYLGGDISSQEVTSRFLRNLLNPISEATGCVWMMIHHTGKPSTDSKSKKHWSQSDYAYFGIGSSELTNWARAVVVLKPANKEQTDYELIFAKRGKRAGIKNEVDEVRTNIFLKHATHGICWEPSSYLPQNEPSKKYFAKKMTDEDFKAGLDLNKSTSENAKDYFEKYKMSARTFYNYWKRTSEEQTK